ncbi:MAG: DUF4332 domain-containing protein, partial [Gammaproteobacteria bacterium]|nr:DUF4332 domain-containing protein [Gammaproteobacteria bacterium]
KVTVKKKVAPKPVTEAAAKEEVSSDGANITDIEGIGPKYGEALTKAGITTVEQLLEQCASAEERAKCAETTGLNVKSLERWVKMSDFFRLTGVAGNEAELLEVSGYSNMADLAGSTAADMLSKLQATNAEKSLAPSVPEESVIESWISQAKTLPAKLTD